MRTNVRIIDNQQEEVHSERTLTEEETKAFLYKNYPDMYKQMYPDEVIEVPRKNVTQNNKPIDQKRVGQDVQKSDKVYVYNKYDSVNVGTDNLNYNIQIKTDMKMD